MAASLLRLNDDCLRIILDWTIATDQLLMDGINAAPATSDYVRDSNIWIGDRHRNTRVSTVMLSSTCSRLRNLATAHPFGLFRSVRWISRNRLTERSVHHFLEAFGRTNAPGRLQPLGPRVRELAFVPESRHYWDRGNNARDTVDNLHERYGDWNQLSRLMRSFTDLTYLNIVVPKGQITGFSKAFAPRRWGHPLFQNVVKLDSCVSSIQLNKHCPILSEHRIVTEYFKDYEHAVVDVSSKYLRWVAQISAAPNLPNLTTVVFPRKFIVITQAIFTGILQHLPDLQEYSFGACPISIPLRTMIHDSAQLPNLRRLGLVYGLHFGRSNQHVPVLAAQYTSAIFNMPYFTYHHPDMAWVGERRCYEAVARELFANCQHLEEVVWHANSEQDDEVNRVVRNSNGTVRQVVWLEKSPAGFVPYNPYPTADCSYDQWVAVSPHKRQQLLALLGR